MGKKDFFNIAICDDEEKWCNAISESCCRYMDGKDVYLNIYTYNNGEILISDMNTDIDLLFLDVEMESMDGLTVMKEVEKMPNIHSIIFVSSHSEMVWDSFGYKTRGFIIKPFTDEALWNRIEPVYSRIFTEGVVKFTDLSGDFYFYKSEIVLLKSDSNYVTIFTENSDKLISRTLKECEKMLGGLPFVRFHKSYIVNLDHVSNISNNIVSLKNGDSYNVGRNYKDQVKKAYQFYLTRELHR